MDLLPFQDDSYADAEDNDDDGICAGANAPNTAKLAGVGAGVYADNDADTDADADDTGGDDAGGDE